MKPKVALVLSGGGARGTAHIGVIEEIEKHGFEISSIAGTSMGAVVGGIYALDELEKFKKWICSLDRLKVFNLVDFSIGQPGLVKAEKVLSTVRGFTTDANIEDLRIPYAAIAADIINKKEVVFTTGKLYDAIRASIAIPSVITPVRTKTGILVDGGVMNNIPVNHVKRIPGDILVVVNVNANIPLYKAKESKKETEKKKSIYIKKMKDFYDHLNHLIPHSKEEKMGYFELIRETISLMTYQIAQLHLDQYKPDIMIEISHESCGNFDFYKAEELIEIGRFAAKTKLSDYLNKI